MLWVRLAVLLSVLVLRVLLQGQQLELHPKHMHPSSPALHLILYQSTPDTPYQDAQRTLAWEDSARRLPQNT